MKKIVEFIARDTCYFRTIRNRRWSLRWRFELSLILLPPPLSPMVRQGRGITSATTATAVSYRPSAIAINRGQLSTSSVDNNSSNIFVAAHIICSSIKRPTVSLHYNMLVTFLRFACRVFRIKNIFGVDRCWCMGCKLYFGCCRNKHHKCIHKNGVYGMREGGVSGFNTTVWENFNIMLKKSLYLYVLRAYCFPKLKCRKSKKKNIKNELKSK